MPSSSDPTTRKRPKRVQARCLDCGKFQRYPEQFYEDECCRKCYDRRQETRRV